MHQIKQLNLQLPQLEIPKPLHQFPHFPDLPSEIRHKIWRLASLEPRTIKLFTDTWKWLPKWHPSHHVEGQSRVPALLHTNQEARREGHRYYECCYERTPWHNLMTIPSEEEQEDRANENTIFINFAVDEFLHEPRPLDADYVEMNTELNNYNFDVGVLSRIRNLTVPYRFSSLSSAQVDQDVWNITSVVELLFTQVLNLDLQQIIVTLAFDYHDVNQGPVLTLDCVDGHLGSSDFEDEYISACSQRKVFRGVTIKGRWMYDQGLVTDLPPCSSKLKPSEFYHQGLGSFGFYCVYDM